ncbi:amidohydrolase family-domain-containing protein [Tricharina praecox]|uniref:amidohydrolase family-domain-containing protein n=1 Tax=Tricharina praecox TaxID=43433 RepID=UPI00221F35BE|nr:amidohydrolase family-domain-containing protein [Tricharina praecox]KAI5856544.1 amidohydrolase family-domain-containing protein [Tricharina praecox]
MLRLLLLLSLPVVFFAFSVSLETLQQYLPSLPFVADKPTIYCYGSITTLDSTSREFTPGCLSVNSDGTFNSPFSATEPQILRRGWPVNLSKHVIPGLWDGHAHLFQYGEMLGTVKVYNTHSIPEILEQICDYHMQHPTSGTKGNWIKGNGWDQSLLPDGMPMASDLPESLYVLLYRVDVHCIWVSRAVLDLLGDEPPVSPPGGSIPSPGVFCDDAMDLVLPFVPSPTREEKRLFVKTAQKSLHSYGIVGMHDAGVVVDDRELYVEMAEKGELKLRVYAMIQCRALNTFCPEEAEMVKREDGMVTVASVKLFADGALGSWGAALLEPYSDDPTTNGTMLLAPSALTEVTSQWARAGYTVCIHAIGDFANRAAIAAISSASPSSAGFRIEHAQIIHPDDQKRLFSLKIIPSIQPTHATSDQFYALARLGEERVQKSAYRMKSFLPLKPVLGSDFPVEPPSVLAGIYAAVTRRDPKTGKSVGGGGGWHTDEVLTIGEALRGFTRNVAAAAGMKKAGKIEGGAWADWVVLDKRLEESKQGWEWLRDETAVKETWVAGKRVFMRGDETKS